MMHRYAIPGLAIMVVITLVALVGWIWPESWLLAAIVGVLALVTFFLVRWHAARAAYVCPGCGYRFAVGAWIDFISPPYPDKKLLRCPSCGKRSWCEEIGRTELSRLES